MSVAARPFSDPRNTYIVNNDDPTAFDKTHRGVPGTHTEQRCCGDRAPYVKGQQYNAYGAPVGDPNELWCHECETFLEQEWASNWVPTYEALIPIGRGIAIAVSYIPVFGTAVSFIINAAITLAQTGEIEDAVLNGIAGALPGQPVSAVAFNTVRSAAAGNRLATIAIDALPVQDSAKTAIKSAVAIVEDIAEGKKITSVLLDEAYKQLPPSGKKAMEVAQRLVTGENVGQILIDELGETAARAMVDAARRAEQLGKDAINSFVLQSGYQGAVENLPSDLRNAVVAGLITGQAQQQYQALMFANNPPQVFTIEEQNKPGNDEYAMRGQRIMREGATWKTPSQYDMPLEEIRNRTTWTYVHNTFNALTGQPEKRTDTDRIDHVWQRGFDVGVAVTEGKTLDGPGQQKVRASLVRLQAQKGFDAAQAIQFERTKQIEFRKGLEAMALSLGRLVSPDDSAMLKEAARQGALLASAIPQIAAARNLNSDGRYKWGYDIGTSITQGKSIPGPGQLAVRNLLGPARGGSGPSGGTVPGSLEAMQGFDVAQALQHGISKARLDASLANAQFVSADVGAGMLIAGGVAGSGSPDFVKASIIQSTLADENVKAGATAVIEEKMGFFKKIMRFFGLA